MTRSRWLQDKAREFVDMRGRLVRSWTGVEAALRSGNDVQGPLTLDLLCGGESVLAFTDPSAAESIRWHGLGAV